MAWHRRATARSRWASYAAVLARASARTAFWTSSKGLYPRVGSHRSLSRALALASPTRSSASPYARWRSSMRSAAAAGSAGGGGGGGRYAAAAAAAASRFSIILCISRTSSRFSSLRPWRFLALRFASIRDRHPRWRDASGRRSPGAGSHRDPRAAELDSARAEDIPVHDCGTRGAFCAAASRQTLPGGGADRMNRCRVIRRPRDTCPDSATSALIREFPRAVRRAPAPPRASRAP